MLNMKWLGSSALCLVLAAGAASPAGATCTKKQYNEVKNGMSYNDVVKILGSEELSRSKVGEYTAVIYMWKCNASGANMNVMFQNDKVTSKAQFGLE